MDLDVPEDCPSAGQDSCHPSAAKQCEARSSAVLQPNAAIGRPEETEVDPFVPELEPLCLPFRRLHEQHGRVGDRMAQQKALGRTVVSQWQLQTSRIHRLSSIRHGDGKQSSP